jgi:hypothetical protein
VYGFPHAIGVRRGALALFQTRLADRRGKASSGRRLGYDHVLTPEAALDDPSVAALDLSYFFSPSELAELLASGIATSGHLAGIVELVRGRGPGVAWTASDRRAVDVLTSHRHLHLDNAEPFWTSLLSAASPGGCAAFRAATDVPVWRLASYGRLEEAWRAFPSTVVVRSAR